MYLFIYYYVFFFYRGPLCNDIPTGVQTTRFQESAGRLCMQCLDFIIFWIIFVIGNGFIEAAELDALLEDMVTRSGKVRSFNLHISCLFSFSILFSMNKSCCIANKYLQQQTDFGMAL